MLNWPSPLARFGGFLKTPTSALLLLGIISLGLTQNLRAQSGSPTPPSSPTPTPTPAPPSPESPSVSSGAVTVSFAYNGTHTTISYTAPSGALAGLTFDSTVSVFNTDQLKFTAGELLHSYGSSSYDIWTAGRSSPDWGTGSLPDLSASSSSGDVFGVISNGFWVSEGYDLFSGSALSGSMTFSNTSLTDLGFSSNTDSSGSFTVGATTVNWTATAPAAAVPEPGTTAIFAALTAVAIVAFGRSRRSVNRPTES